MTPTEITGYKLFNKGLSNRYGQKFILNKLYKTNGPIKWGHNGFHLCHFPEDCFRFFDMAKETDLTIVKGSGEINYYDDEYNGYYDMAVCENMQILKILEREEIIKLGLNLPFYRLTRFLSTIKLDSKEINLFKEKFYNNEEIMDYIAYYQENDKEAFVKRMGSIWKK